MSGAAWLLGVDATDEQRQAREQAARAAVAYAVAWDEFWQSVRALEQANRSAKEQAR
jgi:hypothetical protein